MATKKAENVEVKETAQEEVKNEVAVKETTDLAAVANEYNLDELGFELDELDELSGIESINASDIRVPYGKFYAKIATDRAVGDIELPDGQILNLLNGGVLEGISILKIQPVRVYFPQPYKKNNTFICRSFDSKVGAPDGEYAGHDCASCEFSKYPVDGGSSPCREQQLLLCTLADGTMFYILVSGLSVGEFKRGFMSVEMMKGLRAVKKQLKRSVLAALNITATAEMVNTDNGPFPKLIFRVDKEKPLVSKDRLVANLEAYSGYKEFEEEAVATAATFAQHEQGEHDAAEGSTGQNAEMF